MSQPIGPTLKARFIGTDEATRYAARVWMNQGGREVETLLGHLEAREAILRIGVLAKNPACVAARIVNPINGHVLLDWRASVSVQI